MLYPKKHCYFVHSARSSFVPCFVKTLVSYIHVYMLAIVTSQTTVASDMKAKGILSKSS